MSYSVDKYLKMLRLAGLSENTIALYKKILTSYAKSVGATLSEVHEHLTPDNLMSYAHSRIGKSERGTKLHLGVLRRFFEVNGVTFDPLELNVLKARRYESLDDKPLELSTLKKMMDAGSIHTRAILSVLISTGMRSGECSKLLLSDVDGDIIHIRPEIAKRKRGGDVYLNKEAADMLSLWLQVRPQYLIDAQYKNKGLVEAGLSRKRSEDDQRLFACSYAALLGQFSRLYRQIDGERGRYHAKISPHSTRKYFRTRAIKSMPLDVVEKIMRHSGYLTDSYVRLTNEETRAAYHAGEHVLYILRDPELNAVMAERDQLRDEMKSELAAMKLVIERMQEKGINRCD